MLIVLNGHILNCFQFPGGGEDPYFEGAPYEWWVEGGKKEVEAGQLVGVARAGGLDTESTVYRLRHSYNKPGEEPHRHAAPRRY